MYPPISLAREKDGEFKIPTAKAMPEGRYFMYRPNEEFGENFEGNDLRADKSAKNDPKATMNGMT